MKKIEKYITGYRDEFNIEEPADGHFERFLARQQDLRKKSTGLTLQNLLKIAALILLLVVSSLWLFDRFPAGDDQRHSARITLADIAPEYGDAEIYFTSLINDKYKEIRSFDFDNPRERELLLKELEEMDSVYKALEKELNAERGNQMIVDAMIRHYQLKLDIMSRILDQLQQVRSASLAPGQDAAGLTPGQDEEGLTPGQDEEGITPLPDNIQT